MATSYDSEPVDRLPFGSPDKAARYATERYLGATGLNWWRCDPTLQLLARYHLNLQTARVNTLGDRAEDVFLISGPALADSKTVLQLEQDLLAELTLERAAA